MKGSAWLAVDACAGSGGGGSYCTPGLKGLMLPQGRLDVVRGSLRESFLGELPMLMPKPLAVCVTPLIKLASTQTIQMREVRIRLKRLSPISFFA